MAKSADAFRTISEVADWLDTPAHVLRFWESRFSQIKPVKRAGGRRYYRPNDMRLIGGIKKLLHDDGMTIKGVQKILRSDGIKHVASLSQGLDDGAVIDMDASPSPTTLEKTAVPLPHPVSQDEVPPRPVEPKTSMIESDDGLPAMETHSDESQHPESPTADTADANESLSDTPIARPVEISVPQDPDDDCAAPSGVLTVLSQFDRPLSAEEITALAPIAERLQALASRQPSKASN